MYASKLDGQKLTFFVSGKLWGRSLVMQDRETGSEWSHILGRSMAGELKGKKLEILPSVMTTWGAWKAQHPKTSATMLRPTARQFELEMLTRNETMFGFGLAHNGKARLWRFDHLKLQPVVNDEVDDLKLVVYFDRKSRTPVAWNREVSDDIEAGHSKGKALNLLSFRATEQGVQDVETETIWDLGSGTALSGPLKGTRLTGVPAIVSFTHAWARFHPESTHWSPETH